MAENGQLVSVAVASQLSGVPLRTLHRWIARGHIPAIDGHRGKLVDLAVVRCFAGQTSFAPAPQPSSADFGHVADDDQPMAENGNDVAGSSETVAQSGQPDLAITKLIAVIEELTLEGREKDRLLVRLNDERAELYGRLGFLQAQLQAAEKRILELEAPKEALAEATPAEQNGRGSGSQAVSEISEEQPEVGRMSEVGAPPAGNSQEGCSGSTLKRFWRWLTQPV